MSVVFLDTVGLLALWDVADQWHADAEAAFSKIISDSKRFVTTTFVLAECANSAARRRYRNEVCLLRQKIELRNELIVPTTHDWNDAWREYELGTGGQAGIVDQISFAAMRRLAIVEAFTNDRHFQAAGFAVLF
jgi:predicted nucleic acid-binding protein